MSFILWLAIRGRLSTLDGVHLYDPHVGTLCILCSSSPETHAHLFIECAYNKVIWSHLKKMCDRPWNGHSWPRLITWLLNFGEGNLLPLLSRSFVLLWRFTIFGEKGTVESLGVLISQA
ncbi:hypothetical protein Dsin_005710 [Dipteronia sinensis]|uniref:Reverse transcriptase zinc-binding domain-containing protein n=1 Tax=Dipteronia sinensis TaxID=43782 RepID=A0AAE0EEW1_9ROSI|nr:hypothetical protein Dsin_005710 [Dipteronia sinensis]